MAYKISESTEAIIKKFCKDKPFITLTVGILENGEKTYLSFDGHGNITNEDNSYKLYEIGSITKTFTAALMSKMISEGKATPKTSISDYIGAKNRDIYYPTLERLACHTSGLTEAPLSGMKLFFQVISGVGRKKNIYSGLEEKKMEQNLRQTNLAPTDYPTRYSHYGIAVLGHVLGKIDGRGYKIAITEFLTNELGLNNTYFGSPEDKSAGGYTVKNEKAPCWVWTDKDVMAGSDCLSSCASDLLDFAEINMSGRYSWLDECHTVHAEYDDVDDFGYGFIIREENNVIWHNGSTGVFASFLAFDKAAKRAVVVLSDYEHKPGEMGVDKIGFDIITPKEDNNLITEGNDE